MKNKSLTFALFNFFYATFYAAVQLWFLKTPSKAQIYQSARESYLRGRIHKPFKYYGTTLETVRSPAELHAWLSTVFLDVTYREQTAQTARTAIGSPPLYNTRNLGATVHSFNRILVFRFSIKRWAWRENRRGKFSQEYPLIFQSGSSPDLDASALNENENRSQHCGTGSNGTTVCHDWQKEGGHDDAGGYIFFVDPSEGQAVFEDKLEQIRLFFDRWLGSFTIDMMVYNANEDAFMYMAINVKFDLAGNTQVNVRAQGFDFHSFNQQDDVMCALHVLVTAFLAWLLIAEFRSMWALTIPVYFRLHASWMIQSSILLCAASILSYWVLRETAQEMDFEFMQLLQPDTRDKVFLDLVHFSESLAIHQSLVAFCIFISFLRAVFLIGGLQSNLGLILKVLEVTAYNLFTFFIMFLEIMLGFVFFGFFVFGTKLQSFGSWETGLYTCFAMFTGKSSLRELESADKLMAPLFYYLFYISFFFIFKNLFISILMSGYDIVDYEIKHKDKERNPALLLYDDLKSEVYDPAVRYGSRTATFLSSVLRSCRDSFLECLGVCGLRFSGRERAPTKYGDEDDKKEQAPEEKRVDDGEKGPPPRARFELVNFIRIVIFMVTVLVFVFVSRYGNASYDLSRVTLYEVLHDTDFYEITTFEEVLPWANRTLQHLYMSVQCADYSSYPSTLTSLPSSMGCDDTAGSRQQRVQRVKESIGFLRTTFARLTVGPACFIKNPDDQLALGFPLTRITPNDRCSDSRACQVDLFENGQTCYTPEGHPLDRDNIFNINVPGTSLTYNYSMPETGLGAAGLNGGFVFNFGSSTSSWRDELDLVARGDWFTWKSASMVFDWLTYNGNQDLFTHSKVEFSLMSTGKLEAKASAITFTLNEYVGGGPSRSARIALLVFLILYVTQVCIYVIEMIGKMIWQLVKEGKRAKEIGYLFITDIWTLVDTLSLTISITVMVNYFHLYGMRFRAADIGFRFADYNPMIPEDLVVPTNVTADRAEDLYIFYGFEDFGGSMDTFRTLAALNSFFVSFKVIKYVNTLERVQVFSGTLATGAERMFYFFIILVLLLVGAAMFISTFFGNAVPSVQDPMVALMELFRWILGEFDLAPFMEINRLVAITYFIMYMMLFYFIYVNIFLATMLNTYSEKVGERDIAAAHKEMIMKSGVITVEYDTKEELDKDIELEKDAEATHIKVKTLKGEKAKTMGVEEGYVLVKINREAVVGRNDPEPKRVDVKRVEDMDNPPHIYEDASTNHIMLRFTPPPSHAVLSLSHMLPCMRHTEEAGKNLNVPPTVKNFWRREGATVWVRQQAALKASQPGEMQRFRRINTAEGNGGSELDPPDAGDAVPVEPWEREKDIKKETKETFERLLFSRWMDGDPHGRDGSGGTSMAWETTLHLRNQEDAANGPPKLDWSRVDIEDLRMQMKTLRVSGHEMWLDVLMAAIEREMDEGSVVTSVLGTSEMYDNNAKHAKETKTEQQIREFYERAFAIFQLLEYTAFKKYYRHLHFESEEYQEHLKNQNRVLNDYVCELEKKFTQIMQEILKDREKKEAMLSTLGGLMDNNRHRPLAARNALPDQDKGDR